jgi:glycerol-3-phosphate acyltransferase PlsY
MPDPISWQHAWPYLSAALLGGYLLGSVPFGLLLTRLAGLGDIRRIGSGNIGTTNVLRTGRKDLAALTLLLDGGKGAAAVLVAKAFWGPDMALMAGLGAVLGHLFPVWLRFRGGKGVATTLGVVLALQPAVGAAACLAWLVTAIIFRFSSLAALVACASAPLFAWWIAKDLQLVEMTAVLAALIWSRHLANIRRLITGEEPRIGRSRKD